MTHKPKIEAMYPLSPVQQGMLYETIREPESGMHIEQWSCTFENQFDRAAFERAWQWEIERHSVLRTCFIWEQQSEPLQVVLPKVAMPLEVHDWQHLTRDQQITDMKAYLLCDRRRGFKLSHAPLMRIALFQITNDAYHFVWTTHHILMDGWCVPLVLGEIFSCYQAFKQGKEFDLPPSRPYRDYITWLRQQDETRAEQFWRQSMQGVRFPTPPGRDSGAKIVSESEERERYASNRSYLSAATTATLKAAARAHNVTLNTLLQGVWALLLSCYSGSNDVVFGITVSGRPAELAGVETMIGLCINTLPLRVKIDAQASLWSWLAAIQQYNLELRQYEYISPGRIHQWSEISGSSLLYESLLVVENYPDVPAVPVPDRSFASISNVYTDGAQTKYPLAFLITPKTELEIQCIYDRRRFSNDVGALVLAHFRILLESIASTPGQPLSSLKALLSNEPIPLIYAPLDGHESSPDYQAPRTPIEEVVAALWCTILGRENISIHEDFFTSGGHSLLITQLASRIRETFHIDLPLRNLFEAPTIAGLAQQIAALLHKGQKMSMPPLLPASREQNLPLSYAQERLWFLHRLNPDSTAYTEVTAVHLLGALDLAALERSFVEILQRHESLRTTFELRDEQVVQIIAPGLAFRLPVCDLQHLAQAERERAARDLVTQEALRPFDLARGPLIRVHLVKLGSEEYVLFLSMHHIITDGWSSNLLEYEIVTLYSAFCHGEPSPLAPLSIQYADFALWQRQWLQGSRLDTYLAYWRQQLQGATALELPTDHPRPELRSERGARQTFALSEDIAGRLSELSRREGVTLFMTLLAAFQVLLAHYTDRYDVTVGTDIANRTQKETEAIIGFFVNLLILRTNMSDFPSFRELLARVREIVLGAYTYQDLPFETLVEHLRLPRQRNETPLVRVLFVLQNMPRTPLALSGIKARLFGREVTTSKFELALFLMENAQGLSGEIVYSTDLFEASTISLMVERYKGLLQAILAQPEATVDVLEWSPPVEKKVRRLNLQKSKGEYA